MPDPHLPSVHYFRVQEGCFRISAGNGGGSLESREEANCSDDGKPGHGMSPNSGMAAGIGKARAV